MLRAHPHVSWVSYGDRHNRFIGAWRDDRANVFINRSFPVGNRIRLEEDRIFPDGRRESVRRSDDHGYRPAERPYFRAAAASRSIVWTEPYEFLPAAGSASRAPRRWSMPAARPRASSRWISRSTGWPARSKTCRYPPRARVRRDEPGGRVLIGRRGSGASRAEIIDRELALATVERSSQETEATFEFDHHDETYLGRAVPLKAGNLRWLVEVVVPERDYTEHVDAEGRLAIVLGVLALALAVIGGSALAGWIARPLRELAQLARRIRHGELDVTIVPRSRDEIGVLTGAMVEMAGALRDRDFIREAFGRYVSPELAERYMQDREALKLGGEVREVAMLMSDLRDFSELSERLGPAAMIGLLNGYLARMTPVITQHQGTIVEFIGDAIFVLFGAPFSRADDAERTVRCAVAMQTTLAAMNDEGRRRGLPELRMGIAPATSVRSWPATSAATNT